LFYLCALNKNIKDLIKKDSFITYKIKKQ
jgi:hypothetical protein